MDITTNDDRQKKQRRHQVYLVFKKSGPVGLYKTKLPWLGVNARALKFVMVVPDETWDKYEPPMVQLVMTEKNTVTSEIQVLDALSK